jgi:hypothetical protein
MTTNTRRIPYNGGKVYRKLNIHTNKSDATKEAKDLRTRGILVRIFKKEKRGINFYEIWTHGLTF